MLSSKTDAIDNILTCVASLEATQNILSSIANTGREHLTNHEHAFTKLTLTQASNLINSSVTTLVPSVESDNYFESHSVVYSTESVGKAIIQGVKTAYEKIMKMIKNLITSIKEKWGKVGPWLKTKITNIKAKILKFKEKIKGTPKETLTTAAQATQKAPEGEGIIINTRFGGVK